MSVVGVRCFFYSLHEFNIKLLVQSFLLKVRKAGNLLVNNAMWTASD